MNAKAEQGDRIDGADILGGVEDLPSLPAVVMELLGSLDQEDLDIAVLAKKVSNDPALTAKTLRLANSSAFGLQVKATTIQQAMTYLGFEATRNLITAAALKSCMRSSVTRLWQRARTGSSGRRRSTHITTARLTSSSSVRAITPSQLGSPSPARPRTPGREASASMPGTSACSWSDESLSTRSLSLSMTTIRRPASSSSAHTARPDWP